MSVPSLSTAFLFTLLFAGFSSFLVFAATLSAYLFSSHLSRIPSDDAEKIRPQLLRRVRWIGVLITGLELTALAGMIIAGSFLPGIDLVDSSFLLCIGNLLMIGHVQFSVEREIRELNVTTAEALKQTFTSLLVTGLFYGIYYGVFAGGWSGFSFVLDHSGLSREWQERISLGAVPIAVILALFAISLAAPLIVRLMMPTRAVTDPMILKALERCFERAKLNKPTFWTIEMDHWKFHNAMITGLSFGRGPFRQALLFSRSLVEKLQPDEFEAIIAHEISHLALHHVRKRFIFGFIAVLIGAAVSIPITMFSSTYLPAAYAVTTFAGCYLLALVIQIFLIRRQVRVQEMEADAHAVLILGANFDSFSSAMQKLAALNDQHQDKKDPSSYFQAASAHPTIEKRITALKNRILRHERGEPIFENWEIVSDFFQGRARYVTTAVATGLTLSLTVGSIFSLPRYELRRAAERGDLTKIQGLLAKGYDIDGPDAFSSGFTPLMAAIAADKYDAALLLLNSGADPNRPYAKGFTPAWTAVEYGRLDILKLLVDRGALLRAEFPDNTPLTLVAAGNGHLPVLQYLANKRLNLCARDNKRSTPLTRAAFHGRQHVVRFLIQYGCDINERDRSGDTALLLAAQQGHLPIVSYLIEIGVDINQIDNHRSTALLMASYYGHTEVAKLLITKGARHDALDADGDSALMMARKYGYAEIEKALVAARSDDQLTPKSRALASEGEPSFSNE